MFLTRFARRGGLAALVATVLLGSALIRPAVAEDKSADEKAADEKPAAQNLPAAEEIIAKHIEALGGQENLKKIKSYHRTGTFAVPMQGISGEMITYTDSSNRMAAKLNIPPVGDIRKGYDGEVAWAIDPQQGIRILQDAERDELIAQCEFYDADRYAKHYKEIETVEETDFEGKPCYKVKLVDKNDKASFEFFDKGTGLMAGSIVKQEGPMGEIEVTRVIDEWMDVDGTKQPKKSTVRAMGFDRIITADKIEANNVDPKVFELPDEIKELIKEGKTSKPLSRAPAGLSP